MRQLVFAGPRATDWIDAADPTLSWVHARALLAEPLRLLVEGAFDPTSIASVHRFDDAVDTFAEPFTKLILQQERSR